MSTSPPIPPYVPPRVHRAKEIAAEVRKGSQGDLEAQERSRIEFTKVLADAGGTAEDVTVSWKDDDLSIVPLTEKGKVAVASLVGYMKGTAHSHVCSECHIDYICKGGAATGTPEPCVGQREVMCPYCFDCLAD